MQRVRLGDRDLQPVDGQARSRQAMVDRGQRLRLHDLLEGDWNDQLGGREAAVHLFLQEVAALLEQEL